jgi:hypothetical protein
LSTTGSSQLAAVEPASSSSGVMNSAEVRLECEPTMPVADGERADEALAGRERARGLGDRRRDDHPAVERDVVGVIVVGDLRREFVGQRCAARERRFNGERAVARRERYLRRCREGSRRTGREHAAHEQK